MKKIIRPKMNAKSGNININQLASPREIMDLYDRYYINDTTPDGVISSHWKDYSARADVRIDEKGNITSLKGYGFGHAESKNPIKKILNEIVEFLCNSSYFVRLPYKKDLYRLIKKAVPGLNKIGHSLTHEFFRQICSLCVIRKYADIREDEKFNIVVIGDGYGFLSSLLKTVYPNSKITLIDIGRILLFQAINLQRIHPRCIHRSVHSSGNANPDFLYVPAECLDEIHGIYYKLSINISSMMEMNHKIIESYFRFLRHNSTQDNLFYCCNRDVKTLIGGERIEFYKYPWQEEDTHIVDETCPFYKYYFTIKFPFVNKFDGVFMQRLTNLKIGS